MDKKHSEGRVPGEFTWHKSLLVAAFVFFVCIAMAKAEIIEGDMVYVDTPRVYFSAEPHTIRGDYDTVYFELISKQFSGNIDVAFGFDTSSIRPRSAEFYNNDQWNDVSSSFDVINQDYQGMDRWYVTRNFNVNQGQSYNLRADFEILNSVNTKYWVCAKPSSQTISEAISAGNFMCLDPWANTTYIQRQCWTISNPTGTNQDNTTVDITVNMNTLDVNTDCSDFEWGNETVLSFSFWNFTQCSSSQTAVRWLVKVPQISTSNDTKVCAYFDNVNDTTLSADITKAGLLGDDFEDDDISEYGTVDDFGIGLCTGGKASVDNGTLYAVDDRECISHNLSTTEDLTGFRIFSRSLSVGGGFVSDALFDSNVPSTGYWILEQFSGANTQSVRTYAGGAEIAQASIIISPNFFNVASGRKLDGTWYFEFDNTVQSLGINIANLSSTTFGNFTINLREGTVSAPRNDRVDHYVLTKWCDTCLLTPGPIETVFTPNITIISPENITYNVIGLPLEVVSNKTMDTWWYSLNSGSNITFIPNTTIVAPIGQNFLVVYANDTSNTIVSDNVSFTVSLPTVVNTSFLFDVSNDLPIKDTFCAGDEFVVIRERLSCDDNGCTLNNQTDITVCDYGCSNWTWTTLGNPSCNENDFTFVLMVIVVFLALIALVRVIFR